MGKLQTLDELQAPPGGPAPAGGLASPVPAPVPKGAPPSGRNPDGSKRVISLDEMLPPPAPMFTGGNQRASVLAATPRDATFTSTAGTTGYDPSGLKKVLTAGVKDMQKDPHASDRLLDDVYRLTGNAALMDEAVEKGVGTPLAKIVAASRGVQGFLNEGEQEVRDAANLVPGVGWAVNKGFDAYDFVSKGFSSSLPSVLGAFDVLENVAWAGGAELGQLLPEGETAQNLAAQAGILASKAWKLNPAAPATEELLGLIDSAALGRMGVPVPSGRNANAEEHDRLVGEVAKRFYVALANGDIAKKAETHMMDQEYFGHKVTNLTGTDLLDFAVSKEQAAELAERSESPSDRAFWTALTTTTGREVLGMAAEVVFDPLWFTGAAEGSKLVAAGDNLLRATGSVVADVGAMARHAKVDELHILTELARDADRATQTSLPLLHDIRASAQRALDEAKALAGQVATSPEGKGLVTRAAKNLKVYENDIQRIDRVIGDVQTAKLGERIGKVGTGAYHLPFSHQTRYLFDAGGAAEQVLQRASAPVKALLAPVGAEIERLDKLADAVRYGQAPDSVLTAGNKVSLIVHTLAQTGRVARSVYDLPMLVFDILGRALGTRSFHTAYIPDLREVGSRLLPGSHLTQAADKAARPLGRSAAFGLARYVKGTNREEWARFVDGLAKATMANSVKDQDLMRDIFRLAEESERVWQIRKKAQGSPGGVLQRIREMWKGKDYTSGNVLTEAFDLVERGAGEYEEYLKLHPEMKNVVQVADLLFRAVAQNGQVGIEQARQALQSMARTMRGDFRRFDLFAQKVRQAVPGTDVWGDPVAERAKLVAQVGPSAQEVKDFDKVMQVRPELPTFDGSRPLEVWEQDLWRAYDGFVEAVAPNDPDIRLQAAMLALRDEATLPRDIPGVQGFAKDYAQILGKRFGDVPAEMVPLVEASRDLIRKYEGMYEAAGFDFMKKPAERMKAWGVVNFVPHILDEDAAIQKGKMLSNMGGGHFVAKTSLDARLSTGMDARRLREYAGTMSELNASVTAGNRVFAINPHLLMARFMQGNRAVTAKGFLISLLQSGVAKAFTEGEADVNYVPLFNTHERTRAYDILLAGEQGAYKTLTPQEIDDGLRALRKQSPLKDADPFAAWVNEVPEMRQANVLERMVAEVNGERARAGLPLFTLPDKAAPLEEFEKFANDLNKDYYDMVARLGQPAEGASPLRTTGEWVRNYQQDGMRRLYVAADVYQNVVDSLDIAAQIVESPIIALPKAANDYINNFVKARLTVYRTAFHARNLLWNTFANILDLGPFGVFNLKTQVHANRLALLSSYFNKYGSLVEAEKVLGAARHASESALEYNTRWLKHQDLKTVRDGLGLSDWQHVGLDLGDGIVRTVDDAMRILVDKGVITGAYTDFNDLARFEQGISDLYSKGGVKAVLAGLRRWAKRAEQAGYYGLAFTTAGVPGLMTLIPEKYGQALANYIENQTRLVNFIGNAKRTGSLTEAAAHVQKTLFHYDDLSAFQKVWMRSLMLFYSWNMKNLFFHAQMAIDRPAVYSQMYRLFVDNGPEILNSYFDESEGKHHIGGLARYTPYQEELVFDNERHKFRAPTGVKNTYVTGFGSPVEGALDQGAAIGEMLAGDPRLLGQSSAGIRMALESMFQRSFFYDKEWKDLNSGKPVGILLAGLNHTADQAEGQELSVLASALRTIARGLEVQTEFTAYRETNKSQRARVEDTRISPDAAYWMSELPQRAMLNDWAAYADAYHVALPEASSAAEGSAEGYQPVPFFWRVLDAMGGISLTQIDELRRRQQVQSDHDKAILEILVGRDHMTEYTTPAVKE